MADKQIAGILAIRNRSAQSRLIRVKFTDLPWPSKKKHTEQKNTTAKRTTCVSERLSSGREATHNFRCVLLMNLNLNLGERLENIEFLAHFSIGRFCLFRRRHRRHLVFGPPASQPIEVVCCCVLFLYLLRLLLFLLLFNELC